MENSLSPGRGLLACATGLLLAAVAPGFAGSGVPADPFAGPADLVLHGYHGPVRSVEVRIQDSYREPFGEWRAASSRLLVRRVFDQAGRLRLVATNEAAAEAAAMRLGAVTRTLDNAGRVLEEEHRLPDGRPLTTVRHLAGVRIETNWIYGPQAAPEACLVAWYGTAGRVVRRLLQDGAGKRVYEARYDAAGRLEELHGPDERLRLVAWGAAGEPWAVSVHGADGGPEGRLVFTHDGDGRVLEVDRFDGRGARLTKTVYRHAAPGLLAHQAVFDGAGRLLGEELRERDASGRLLALRRLDGDGRLLSRRSCSYAESGDLLERVDSNGDLRVRRSWTREGLTLERAALAELATVWKSVYRYDPYGRLVRLEAWNERGERTRLLTVAYDRRDNPVEIVDHGAVFEPGYSFRENRNTVYEYEYDARGNWIVCRVFRRVGAFGGVRLEPDHVLVRRFVYYGPKE